MEQIDQTLIERYLADEMTLSERNEVERRAKDDAQFRKDLAEYKLSIEAIKLSEREVLKNRFRQRDKVLDQKNTAGRQGTRYYMLIMAAAAVISILVAWYFLYTPDRTIDEAKNETRDSTSLVQNPPVIIDTIKKNDVKNKEIKPTKEDHKPKKTGDQIFAENFEVYKDDAMDPTSRSGEENLKPQEKFQLQYWEGKYKDAQATFRTLSPAEQQNDNLRFLYANVLMAMNKTVEASLILKGIIQNHKSIFTSESQLYLALCEIKADKNSEAKKYLQAYLQEKDVTKREMARNILKGLE